jgi:hypothetical protein
LQGNDFLTYYWDWLKGTPVLKAAKKIKLLQDIVFTAKKSTPQ